MAYAGVSVSLIPKYCIAPAHQQQQLSISGYGFRLHHDLVCRCVCGPSYQNTASSLNSNSNDCQYQYEVIAIGCLTKYVCWCVCVLETKVVEQCNHTAVALYGRRPANGCCLHLQLLQHMSPACQVLLCCTSIRTVWMYDYMNSV